MNKRIQELAEQAGITTNLDTDFFEKDPNKWVDYFAEKFVELIVQEVCFDMINSHIDMKKVNIIAQSWGLEKFDEQAN